MAFGSSWGGVTVKVGVTAADASAGVVIKKSTVFYMYYWTILYLYRTDRGFSFASEMGETVDADYDEMQSLSKRSECS